MPIDMLLFCPHCGEQHVDEAKPDVCETCGGNKPTCTCDTFTAWLNPSHKSHRCNFCNHVFRPADVPTNGVQAIKSKGERDGNPRPRYYYTAKDYEDAVTERVAAENEACAVAVEQFDGFVYTSYEDDPNVAIISETATMQRLAETIRARTKK